MRPGFGRLYLHCVVAGGAAVVLHSVLSLWQSPVPQQWFVLAGLTLLSGSFTVRIPAIPARLSVSETFVFAAVLLYGPAAATIIVVLDTLVISLWLRASSRSLQRVLFNMAAPAVAIWIAAHGFFALAQIEPLSRSPQYILSLLLPLFALAICYFLLNSVLVAVAVALEKNASALAIWKQNFVWLSLNYLSGASVAALLLPYLQATDSQFIRIVGVLLPLLLISYLTFKTALGRVEDANRHLRDLNKLYLSTIETLAMAIDAKDQITHGHIRRVQTQAVDLARALGVTDELQIRAIEAAALLHDMGKLAIPEYILNKPGPLTPAEFDKMKLHASVGADILSAIDFPYPVVPIVRHHHESWDGTGYPAGLSGSDIPLGARILSVVDCFDALTSDRPYRPKLSDEHAIAILRDRRGTMYDPLVVDTFIQMRSESLVGQDVLSPARVLPWETSPISPVRRSDHDGRRARLSEIAASQVETIALLQFAKEIVVPRDHRFVASAALRHLASMVPYDAGAVLLRNFASERLDVVESRGPYSDVMSAFDIYMGQRLSGWVAANRRSIKNSDPVLDFGDASRSLQEPLRSALSVPIATDGEVLGVLTVYSSVPNAFSDDHQRIAEAIVTQMAQPLKMAPRRSPLASTSGPVPTGGIDQVSAAMYVRLFSVMDVRLLKGDAELPASSLMEALRGCVRPIDDIAAPNGDEVVIFLVELSRETAAAAAMRIRGALDRWCSGRGARHRVRVATALALAPDDGSTREDLLEVARLRVTESLDEGRQRHDRKSVH